MKGKVKILKKREDKVRKNKFNRIEWINCFNNEITIESISNQLNNNSKSEPKNFKKKLTNKNYNILNQNSHNNKVIYIEEEEFIYFPNNHNLRTNKNNDRTFINKNRNIKINNRENKKKNTRSVENKKKENDNKLKQGINNIEYKEKSKSNKKNKSEINKTKYMQSYTYNARPSYAKRHKIKKGLKINQFFSPNKKKVNVTNNNIWIERTLPEMKVLNNFGLVNDEEYEFYKKLNNIKYKLY